MDTERTRWNRHRDDRENDGVRLEIERYRDKEIETDRLREAGENEIAAYS